MPSAPATISKTMKLTPQEKEQLAEITASIGANIVNLAKAHWATHPTEEARAACGLCQKLSEGIDVEVKLSPPPVVQTSLSA